MLYFNQLPRLLINRFDSKECQYIHIYIYIYIYIKLDGELTTQVGLLHNFY